MNNINYFIFNSYIIMSNTFRLMNELFGKPLINILSNSDTEKFLGHDGQAPDWKKIQFSDINGNLPLIKLEDPDPLEDINNERFIKLKYSQSNQNNITIWDTIDINDSLQGLLNINKINWPCANQTGKFIKGDGSCSFIDFDDIMGKIETNQITAPENPGFLKYDGNDIIWDDIENVNINSFSNNIDILSLTDFKYTFNTTNISPSHQIIYNNNDGLFKNKINAYDFDMKFNTTETLFKLNNNNYLEFSLSNSNLKSYVDFDLNNLKLINVPYPINLNDGANKKYVDDVVLNATSGSTIVNIENLANYPDDSSKVLLGNGAWNKILDSNISDTAEINISKLANFPNNSAKILFGDGNWGDLPSSGSNELTQFGNNVSLQDLYKITNSVLPTNPKDLANKQYVDTAIANNGGGGGGGVPLDFSEGIFTKLTIVNDNPGFTITGSTLTAGDIPNLTVSKLTDFNTSVDTLAKLVKLNEFVNPDSSLDLNSQKIVNLLDPVFNTDASNKLYVDTSITTAINNLPDPVVITFNSGTFTKMTVIDNNPGFTITGTNDLVVNDITNLNTVKLNFFSVPDNDIDMNTKKILQLADPINNTDGANKSYVDTAIVTAINNLPNNSAIPLNFQEGTFTKLTIVDDLPGYTITGTNNLVHNDITDLNTFKLNNFAIPDGDINMNNKKITNVATPVSNNDVANKNYVDDSLTFINLGTFVKVALSQNLTTSEKFIADGGFLVSNDIPDITSDKITDFDIKVKTIKLNEMTIPDLSLNLNSQKIINLLDPVDDQDAVTKKYMSDNVGSLISSVRLDELAIPTNDLNINNNKLTMVADPIADKDVVNKLYMETHISNQFPTITGGDFTKVTVNTKGLITGNSSLIPDDIPTLTVSKLSDYISETERLARLSQSINLTANGLTYDDSTGILTLGLADTNNIGALSNTDWNTFNNKVNKSGDTMSGNLLFEDTFGIDSVTNGNLNIGCASTTINLACTPSTATVNIGVGSDVNIINIGGPGDTVNISGSLNHINTTNTEITDKTIVLNKGSTTSGSARGAGFEFRDNNVDGQGYIKVNNLGNGFEFKGPESAYKVSIPSVIIDSSVVLNKKDQSIDGNLNITAGKIFTIDNVQISTDNVTEGSNLYSQWVPDSTKLSYQLGNVGIGANADNVARLFVEGDQYINGKLFTSDEITSFDTNTVSDLKYKQNINKITNTKNIIEKLQPVEFNWKNDIFNNNKKGKYDTGFIAQDVELLAPHLISEFLDPIDKTISKSVHYEKIIPYLVEYVQELKKENLNLKLNLENLNNKVDKLLNNN